MKEQIGKYCLDISKLVLGGAIISTIVKQDLPILSVVMVGGSAFVLLVIAGFLFIKDKKN
jgi:hypothetical protein